MADNNLTDAQSAPGLRIAITGATGFVGRALLAWLDDHSVTALCRGGTDRGGTDRGREISTAVHWIDGDLDDRTALANLVAGADVVIHLAGLTKALNPQDFHHINAEAAGQVAQIAAHAGVKHFVLLSSLAATRPDVSDYAASKAQGEAAVRAVAGDMRLSIIRAPAVLGPGDDATKPLFSQLAKGFAIAPGGAARDNRFSVIDVQDLARLLAELAQDRINTDQPIAPYSEEIVDFARMAAATTQITGRKTRIIALPRPMIVGAGKLADLWARISRRPEVFSSGKVREIYAGDWIADHAVCDPTPLETTLNHCLAPFLGAKPNVNRHA